WVDQIHEYHHHSVTDVSTWLQYNQVLGGRVVRTRLVGIKLRE
ncbi:MAG: hypothetical protein RL378_53, partial [Actinomycetota bacterium]